MIMGFQILVCKTLRLRLLILLNKKVTTEKKHLVPRKGKKNIQRGLSQK